MKIHMSKRLFLPAAVLGALAVFAIGFFVALGVRSVVAGPDSAPAAAVPNPGHSYDQIELPAGTWPGLDADTLDGMDTGAQTRYYSIAPADFTSYHPDVDDVAIVGTRAEVEGASSVTFQAPVHLPHGAVIKRVCVYGVADTEGWSLYSKYIVDETFSVLMNTTIGSCATGSITVDNETYVYPIVTGLLDQNEKLYGARVDYEITALLP